MKATTLGPGLGGKSLFVNAKGMQNAYAELRPAGEKGSRNPYYVAYRSPALATFADAGTVNPPRGIRTIERLSQCYAVISNTFYQVSASGTLTNKATLMTSLGRVSMSDDGTQVMVVDGTYGYIYSTVAINGTPQTISSITRSGTTGTLTTSAPHLLTTGNLVTLAGVTPSGYNGTYTITVTSPTTFTFVMKADPGGVATVVGTYTIPTFAQITDTDFPPNPQTVTFLGGMFIVNFNQSGRFYVNKNRGDGLLWDALNFANAETNPDPIVSVWSSNGQLDLLGSASMEFWGNSGTLDFPFTQILGSATEWGLAATWSVAKFDNSFACLVKNRMGQVMVAHIAGYLPKKISTPDLDFQINSYSRVDDATAYSYMIGGHAMYVISFPTAGKTWLYDSSTGFWSSLKSYGLTRHRGEFGTTFAGKTLVCDYQTGIIWQLSTTAMSDATGAIESQIVMETIQTGDLDRITVSKLRLDMEVGDGTTSIPSPQISLQVSRDNGNTYGAEMFTSAGSVGNYNEMVEWNRLGTARNFVFKVRMVDAVPFVLVGASINPKD